MAQLVHIQHYQIKVSEKYAANLFAEEEIVSRVEEELGAKWPKKRCPMSLSYQRAILSDFLLLQSCRYWVNGSVQLCSHSVYATAWTTLDNYQSISYNNGITLQ